MTDKTQTTLSDAEYLREMKNPLQGDYVPPPEMQRHNERLEAIATRLDDLVEYGKKDRQKTIEYNALVKEARFLREVVEQAEMDMGFMIDCMSKQDKHLCTECKDRLTRALGSRP